MSLSITNACSSRDLALQRIGQNLDRSHKAADRIIALLEKCASTKPGNASFSGFKERTISIPVSPCSSVSSDSSCLSLTTSGSFSECEKDPAFFTSSNSRGNRVSSQISSHSVGSLGENPKSCSRKPRRIVWGENQIIE